MSGQNSELSASLKLAQFDTERGLDLATSSPSETTKSD
jgi:hypothetical protein